MRGNIIGENFAPGVVDEINLRQKLHGSGFNKVRSPQQIQFLNNRNAWLKLASSVYVIGDNTNNDFPNPSGSISIDKNEDTVADGVERLQSIGIEGPENFVGNQLAQKCVLFNTLSEAEFNPNGTFKQYNQRSGVTKSNSFWNSNNSYGLGGTNMGISPTPGLIDCSIDCINRGSIRKAQVSLKAYNKFQFELIELLYLRLGFTMMLEWGWDKYMGNDGTIKQVQNTIIEDTWFNNKAATQHSVVRSINEYREKYQYNYDGFFGKVSNFDWTFNGDGTYDISIDLITIGDVVESFTARNKVLALSPGQIRDAVDASTGKVLWWDTSTGVGKIKTSTIVTTAGDTSLGNYMFRTIAQWPAEAIKGINVQGYLYSWESSRTRHNKQDSTAYPAISSEHYNYFMTFGHLLKLIQELIMPMIIKEVPECVLDIDMNEDKNICSTYPNLISFDPTICLIKPHIYDNKNKDNKNKKANKFKSLNYPNYLNDLKEFNITKGDCVYGKMLNIYINFQFISDTLLQVNEKKELSIFDFLKKITTGINKALGNNVQLEPIIKDDYIITIIDQNPIPLFKPKPITPTFEVFGITPGESATSNFVTDIKFQTSITPGVASMITIGATAGGSTKNTDATAWSKWNQGIFDRTNPAMIDNPNVEVNYDYKDGTEEQIKAWKEGDVQDTESLTRGVEIKNVTYNGQRWRNVDYTEFLTYANGNSFAQIIASWISSTTKAFFDSTGIPIILKGIRAWLYDETEQYSNNYALYLVKAFGGKINVTMDNNEVKPISIFPSTSLYNTLSEEFINVGHQAFNAYSNLNNERIFTETGTPSPKIGFIPMSIDLTFEGMSGVKIYNGMALKQRFLPPQYSKALKFIIEKVNHKIGSNTWSTDLGTISVPEVDNKHASPFSNLGIKSTGENILEVFKNKGPIPSKASPNKPLRFYDARLKKGFNSIQEITLETAVSYLNKNVQPQFSEWFNYLKNNGYDNYKIRINSVARSFARSVELKEENSDNATPGKSPHNYSAGIDINIIDPSKRVLIKAERQPWIEQGFVDAAEKFGIKWGGNIAGYIDSVHFYHQFNRDTAIANAAADNPGKPQKDWDTQNTKLEGKPSLQFNWSKLKKNITTPIINNPKLDTIEYESIMDYELPDGSIKTFTARDSKKTFNKWANGKSHTMRLVKVESKAREKNKTQIITYLNANFS